MSRRGMLVASLALAAPITVEPASAQSPDAEMIRLCGVYVRLCNEYNTGQYSEAEGEAIHARMLEVEGSISDMPPRTLEGVLAKAQTAIDLAVQEPEERRDWGNSPAGGWAREVVLDLVRLYGAGGAA
jgi:hypothetical protein